MKVQWADEMAESVGYSSWCSVRECVCGVCVCSRDTNVCCIYINVMFASISSFASQGRMTSAIRSGFKLFRASKKYGKPKHALCVWTHARLRTHAHTHFLFTPTSTLVVYVLTRMCFLPQGNKKCLVCIFFSFLVYVRTDRACFHTVYNHRHTETCTLTCICTLAFRARLCS